MQETLLTIRQIAMVINRASGYKKNMHAIEIDAEQKSQDVLKSWVDVVKAAGLVALIKDDIQAAETTNADGVVLSDMNMVDKARHVLGEDRIIGLLCGVSKDMAQKALSADVDYIAVGIAGYGFPDIGFIRALVGKSAKPILALGDISSHTCGFVYGGGASLIDCTPYIDRHEDGVAQATVNFLHALNLVMNAEI